MSRTPRALPLLFVLLTTATWSCSGGSGQPAAPSPGVSAPGLGISLATVPSGLEVRSTTADRIILAPKDPQLGGTLEIGAGPAEAGLNLQEAVKLHQAEIEARPGGRYLGARELSGPTGTAYWSRGRFTEDGRQVEEARIVTLDPTRQRILQLSYVYPARGDSAQRVNTLLEVTGEIESCPSKNAS